MTAPIARLAATTFDHFYRGGERIAALRRPTDVAVTDARQPEEWLASVVSRWQQGDHGLTRLDSGRWLRDVVADDPIAWLGGDHVARWGTSPALLVKLLDAGQRLPVHLHPTRAFAARHLDCPFGKTEAWVVVDTPVGGGTVHVGTTRPVAAGEWAELVAGQDSDTMLGLLHDLTVHPGDGVLVPAGTPHAIGADVFVVELQEPTDFSILLEWGGFDLDGARDGHLGLGFDVALGAVRPDALSVADVDALVRRRLAAGDDGAILPPAANPYFRAWRFDRSPDVEFPAAFSVVVALDGAGTLSTTSGEQPLARGDVVVVGHGAGPLIIDGAVRGVVAQPPDPAAPDPIEWDAP